VGMNQVVNDVDEAKKFALICYILYAVGFFTGGLTSIAGIILAYIKKDDAVGTWTESHYRWLIRTFWFGLLLVVIGAPTMLIPVINIFIYLAIVVWIIYRIIKGWLRLSENKPMYVDQAVATSVSEAD
jgi:uncharacterized membrane protein